MVKGIYEHIKFNYSDLHHQCSMSIDNPHDGYPKKNSNCHAIMQISLSLTTTLHNYDLIHIKKFNVIQSDF